MPHVVIEHSADMEARADIAGLCDALRKAALETGLFSPAGVRVRAHRCDFASLADGSPDNGFVDICVRLRAGRPLAARREAAARIFAAAEDFLRPALAAHPVALSLEMREIDPELSLRRNTIRERLRES